MNNSQPFVRIIHDLQFGSTGKGALAGYIGSEWNHDAVATAWGTNAGHTMDVGGSKWISTQIASTAVFESVKFLFVGPGSMINPSKFIDELDAVQEHRESRGYEPLKVIMHEAATVITHAHVEAEAARVSIGSTMKGNSEALMNKLRRDPTQAVIIGQYSCPINFRDDITIYPMALYRSMMAQSLKLLVEGAQGLHLGINQQFYPYCTSRECTPAQIMTDCGIPGWWGNVRYGTARTYPIRVSNRYDQAGNMVGWSGPHFPDQTETQFHHIGVKEERTTVTHLPRRIFTWSDVQMQDAIDQTMPHVVFLNFCNYGSIVITTRIIDSIFKMYKSREMPVELLTGWGAKSSQIVGFPADIESIQDKVIELREKLVEPDQDQSATQRQR